jgi:hypothetical protein
MQLFSILAVATCSVGAPSLISDPLAVPANFHSSATPAIKLEGYQETIKTWFKGSKKAVEKFKIYDGQIYAYYKETPEWYLGQSISIDKNHRIADGVIEEYSNLKWRVAVDYQIDIRHHAINGFVCFWNGATKTWDRIENDLEIKVDGVVGERIKKELKKAGKVIGQWLKNVEHKIEE